MKRLMITSLFLSALAVGAVAGPLPPPIVAAGPSGQTTPAAPHSAVITWIPATDSSSTSTYDVFRVNAACPSVAPGSLTWTKITATPLAQPTSGNAIFTDSTITVGQWCWYVVQNQNGVASAPSNTAGGLVRPNTVTIQITIQ